MKKNILVCLLILVLITTIFAAQIVAENDKCTREQKKLTAAEEKVDRYCSKTNYNERQCTRYQSLVAKYEVLVAEYCPTTCTDSDVTLEYPDGKNQFLAGIAQSTDGSFSADLCNVNGAGLNEGYCAEDGTAKTAAFICMYGCENGACIEEPPTPTCTDTDGGLNYYEKGYATNGAIIQSDICKEMPGANLIEGFCEDGVPKGMPYMCPNGCSDGACIEDIPEPVINFHITFSGNDQSKLGFMDNAGGIVNAPLLYSDYGNLKLGDYNDDLITQEGIAINKNDYIVVTAGSDSSYVLRYKGADRVPHINQSIDGQGTVKFDELGTGQRIVASYDSKYGAKIMLGGMAFKVKATSDDSLDDFDVVVDLNADTFIDSESVDIVDSGKASISLVSGLADFQIVYSGISQSTLKFQDNANNLATIPLLYSDNESLKLGDNDNDLITKEGVTINKNDYLIVTGIGQSSYALRYKGANSVAPGSIPLVKFDELGTGNRIEVSYDRLTGATLHLGGYSFKVISVSYDGVDDFDVKIDLNADGDISGDETSIVTYDKKALFIDTIQDECSTHELSMGEVINNDGKISVDYKTVGAGSNVNVELITPDYSSNITGIVKVTNCPITGIRECKVAYGSDVEYCTVNTECNYPAFDLGQSIRVTDVNCKGIYDEMDVFSTPTSQQLLFGVYDSAPASDIILAIDFVQTLAAEGYGTAPILLFSEIDIYEMDYTEFTVLVYEGEVIVVEGSSVAKEESLYQHIVNYLNNNDIGYNITESEMITSSDLLDLFIPTPACTDTDGGLNYYVKGYATNGATTQSDICNEMSGANLIEGFCDNGVPIGRPYNCPAGCQDGKCIIEIA